MKLVKRIQENLPKDYEISIFTKYEWDNWEHEYVVEISGKLINKFDTIKSYKETVCKPPKRKYIFFKNEVTWKEACQESINSVEQYLRDWLFVTQKDEEVNQGLFDSLDNL